MEIEIKKTENGYHCKDKADGEWCFQTIPALLEWLALFLPEAAGSECKLQD